MPEDSPANLPPRAAPSLGRSGPRPYAIILSVVLGALIWLYVDSRRTDWRVLDVPLDLNIPAGWEIEDGVTSRVQVRVRGPRQSMAGLKQDEVRVVETLPEPPDETAQEYRVPLTLTEADVRGVPPGVQVTVEDPQRIDVKLVRLVTRYLRVEVATAGTPASGYAVALTQAEPWFVEVRVPQGLVDEQDRIRTEPVDLTGRSNGFAKWVQLQPFIKSGRMIHVDRQVYASVEIIEKPAMRRMDEKTPVRVLLDPEETAGRVELQPAAVRVTVSGFADNLNRLGASDIRVYVDAREKIPLGQHRYMVKCRSLPLERAQVVEIDPPEVQMIITPPAAALVPAEPSSESQPQKKNEPGAAASPTEAPAAAAPTAGGEGAKATPAADDAPTATAAQAAPAAPVAAGAAKEPAPAAGEAAAGAGEGKTP